MVLGRKGGWAERGKRGREGGRPVPVASGPYGGRRGPHPPCSHKAPCPWARHQSCGRDQLEGSHVWESSSGSRGFTPHPRHPQTLPHGSQGHPQAVLLPSLQSQPQTTGFRRPHRSESKWESLVSIPHRATAGHIPTNATAFRSLHRRCLSCGRCDAAPH